MPTKRKSKRRNRRINKHDMLKCYLKEVKEYSVLSREEELELSRRIKEEKSVDARERLICANLRFVVRVARRYGNRGLDLVELIDAGNHGLMHAVEKFDYHRGYRFNTYAAWWIKRAIFEALEKQGSLVRVSSLAKRIKQANVDFAREHGRKPTDDELSEILHVEPYAISLAISELRKPRSIEELKEQSEYMFDIMQSKTQSDDDPFVDPFLYNFEGLNDFVGGSLDEMSIKQEKVRRFWSAFDHLPSREKEVLQRNFGLGEYEQQTLEEISRVMEITRERVRQIKENGLKHIRCFLEKQLPQRKKLRIFDMKRNT